MDWFIIPTTLLCELEKQVAYPSVINAYRSLVTDKEGRIWAGTAEGLVYSLQPTAVLSLSNTPQLKKITINEEVQQAHGRTTIKIKGL